MYRPYTTTGTNKEAGLRLKVFFWFFWTIALTGSRIAYLFLKGGAVADTYGYFAHAMVRSQKGEPALDSGLAYAYTKNLSGLLRFTGNRIEAVGIYQMILQILWLILLLVGLILLAGWLCGVICGGILLVSPGILDTMLTVSAGNYYLLHVSIILVILGVICRRVQKKGWLTGDKSRLCLIATGFYVGVICIWNCLGLCLLPVMAYVLVRGHLSGRKVDRAGETEGAKEQGQSDSGKEEDGQGADRPRRAPRSLRAGSQALVLCEGILFGIFVTLMRYTGVTGQAVLEQFLWWLSRLRDPLRQFQDIQLPMILWLLGGVGAGIVCQILLRSLKKSHRQRRSASRTGAQGSVPEEVFCAADTPGTACPGTDCPGEKAVPAGRESEEDSKKVEQEQGNYVITQDGRRVRLLDNPLPGPRKHVRREMEFDITDVADEESATDDFDIQIKENDDFDI